MLKKAKDEDDFDEIKKELGSQKILSVDAFLSTGSTLLDYAIANRKDGGVPVGRVTEIHGNEATGKSLIAYHIMANTQKRDGIAIYLDIERAADETFMKRMGVDVDSNFIYPDPMPITIEAVFSYIENVIKIVRRRYPKKEKIVTVVWDSIAATKAQASMEVDYGEGAITPEARAMSKCLNKAVDALDRGYITTVCVNQLRKKIGVSFGDDEVTPHGKAIPFYASARVKLKSIGKIKENSDKNSRIIGVNCRADVVKDKVAPPHRKVEFPIFFDWGVGDDLSWLKYLKSLELVKTSGAWSTLKIGGLEKKYQGLGGWRKVVSEPEVRNKILNIIDEDMVIKFDERPTTIVEDAITEKGKK